MSRQDIGWNRNAKPLLASQREAAFNASLVAILLPGLLDDRITLNPATNYSSHCVETSLECSGGVIRESQSYSATENLICGFPQDVGAEYFSPIPEYQKRHASKAVPFQRGSATLIFSTTGPVHQRSQHLYPRRDHALLQKMSAVEIRRTKR